MTTLKKSLFIFLYLTTWRMLLDILWTGWLSKTDFPNCFWLVNLSVVSQNTIRRSEVMFFIKECTTVVWLLAMNKYFVPLFEDLSVFLSGLLNRCYIRWFHWQLSIIQNYRNILHQHYPRSSPSSLKLMRFIYLHW